MKFRLQPVVAAVRTTFRHAGLPLGVLAAGLPSTGWTQEPAPAVEAAPAYPAPDEPARPMGADTDAEPASALAVDPAGDGDTAGEPAITLEPVQVEGGRDDRYRPGVTRVGKQEQSLQDIPQSVSVVGEELMLDRAAYTFREALRNVAGLTFNAGEGGRIGDNITIRGYSVVGDLYLDGMRDAAQYNRETFNLQQIDVLRGSASMLYGRGSTGGVVNQASKQPSLGARNSVDTSTGSDGYTRITADYSQPLGVASAGRMNAMFTSGDSFREGASFQRYGLAPAVSFGLGGEDELTASYYLLEEDNVPDMGVPYFKGRPLPVPATRFYGLANADREENRTGIATVAHTHRFAADTSVRTALRAADYERALWATAPRLADTNDASDSAVINRNRQWRGSTENTLGLQSDLRLPVMAFGFRQDLLTGVEVLSEQADRWSFGSGTVTNPTTTVGNPDPTPALPAGYYADQQIRRLPASYQGASYAAYVQDTLEIVPTFKVLAGARYDYSDVDYVRTINNAGTGNVDKVENFARKDIVWSWRTGALLQPSPQTTYYASYGTSFNPSAELYQLDPSSDTVDPEKSRNIEIGAKWLVLDEALSLRAAVARTEKTNERNTDLSLPQGSDSVLYGKRHTDSLELEATGQVGDRWEIAAAAAVLKSNIDRALPGATPATSTEGRTPINTPDYTASVWATCRIAPRWRAGAGIEAVGDRYGNATNVNSVPEYERYDAMVSYEHPSYGVQLNVLNLTDAEYYEGVYQGHAVPGQLRTALLKFELKL